MNLPVSRMVWLRLATIFLSLTRYRAARKWLARISNRCEPQARTTAYLGSNRTLVIDVSVIHWSDAGTGVQRVVRSILRNIGDAVARDITVRLAVATSSTFYRYVNHDGSLTDEYVNLRQGDVFLGLDLSTHIVYRYKWQLLDWKLNGAHIHFLVYDLLPLTNPGGFRKARVKHFAKWASVVAIFSDSVLCISHCVENDARTWLGVVSDLSGSSLRSVVVPLGSELMLTHKDVEDASTTRLLDELKDQPWVLMVGTLEPRKAYSEVLDAFDILWMNEDSPALVIVGKPGWKVDRLKARILTHPLHGRKLYWLASATDSDLDAIYRDATGVLAASFAEGYGLPLAEAMLYGCSVLARDIPVFREVTKGKAEYFSDVAADLLALKLNNWIRTVNKKKRHYGLGDSATWTDSARFISAAIGVCDTILANSRK